MTKVLIVYATDYGNTKKMAEVVAEGAKSVPDTEVEVKVADDVTAEDLLASDGIIVGTPVHMGSPDWRVKKFIDTVCSKQWMADTLIGKVGAVFTTGGGYGNAGGGCELTMLALFNNFAELGMLMVPLPKTTPGYPKGGIQWGPHARTHDESLKPIGASEETLEAAKYHGANVARVASVLAGKDLFAKAN